MKEIATMFDLEWLEDENRSEIFSVINDEGELRYDDCYISLTGFFRLSEPYLQGSTFYHLLTGTYTIRKHLRKGDSYYLIDPYKQKGYKKYIYRNDNYDNYWLKTDRLYRTEKEAQEAVQKLGWDINTETP